MLPVWSPDGVRIACRSGTNTAPMLKVSSRRRGTGAVNVSGGDVWACSHADALQDIT
ncbi:hypothetical protein [Luteitalea pratensis]|uniref:hypothetical protein n=1 Tax=Luteitalea pratensis TaxID=1855912 RepID=UPI0012FFC019|nr:hypothetical protein [Luteitalea pratensis]